MENTLRPTVRFDVRALLVALREKLTRRETFDYSSEIVLTDELERKLSQQEARW
jgi:hypothetical protein